MTAFASTDITVTLNAPERDIGGGGVFKNISIATIAFGNGALTYATGGVPMPAIGRFGMKRAVDLMLIEQPSANGFIYKYDAANNKIKIFTQGFLTGGTVAGAAENGALVTDSAGAEATAPRMPKTAVNTTYDTGPMIELPNGLAPAAVTIKALVVGS